MARRTTDSQVLKTTVDVMRALGGLQAVCALTGSGYKATENWSRAETFPPRFFLVMTFALWRRGLSAPPELWGQVTPAERKQALSVLIAGARKQRNAA